MSHEDHKQSNEPNFWDEAPKGVIVLWGTKSAIPHGWSVCDGTKGTPNLSGRFPLGTSNSAEIGNTGGSLNHNHVVKGTTGHENKHRDQRDGNGMEGEGDECMFHDHSFNVTSDDASSMPPFITVFFIMKL